MSKYEQEFLKRHGEIGLLPLLPLLENWERTQGIKHAAYAMLEDRWVAFMQGTASNVSMAIAA